MVECAAVKKNWPSKSAVTGAFLRRKSASHGAPQSRWFETTRRSVLAVWACVESVAAQFLRRMSTCRVRMNQTDYASNLPSASALNARHMLSRSAGATHFFCVAGAAAQLLPNIHPQFVPIAAATSAEHTCRPPLQRLCDCRRPPCCRTRLQQPRWLARPRAAWCWELRLRRARVLLGPRRACRSRHVLSQRGSCAAVRA